MQCLIDFCIILIFGIILWITFQNIGIAIFGGIFIGLILEIITTLFSKSYIPCFYCNGLGAIDLKLWQKKFNKIVPNGFFGKRCVYCKGDGFIPILSQISQSELVELNNKYKKSFGKKCFALEKYLEEKQ